MVCFPQPNLCHRVKRAGSSLIFTVAFMVVLLGFLGMALYTGANALVQNELQGAANTAALVGAAAYYDGTVTNPNNSLPVKCSECATQAAQATFDRIIANSDVLQNVNSQAGAPITNDGDDSVRIDATARFPTPFLSLLGIDEFQIEATGKARYVKYTLTNPAALPSATGGSVAVRVPGNGLLPVPLVDGPGPDLRISFGGNPRHGYLVEACTNSSAGGGATCTDIGPAARMLDPAGGNATMVDRLYPAGPRRVLYGDAVIDLGATNGAYNYGPNGNTYARKASFLKILDDGIPDLVEAGQRVFYFTAPAPGTTVAQLDIYHLSVICPPTNGNCPVPNGIGLSAMAAGDFVNP